jgi:hypothetical protein
MDEILKEEKSSRQNLNFENNEFYIIFEAELFNQQASKSIFYTFFKIENLNFKHTSGVELIKIPLYQAFFSQETKKTAFINFLLTSPPLTPSPEYAETQYKLPFYHSFEIYFSE